MNDILQSVLEQVVPITLGLVVAGFFIWLIVPSANAKPRMARDENEPFVEPDDSRQIGLLAGMTGGTIPDAALMRLAFQRFQAIHGRRATSRDIGTVLALAHSLNH